MDNMRISILPWKCNTSLALDKLYKVIVYFIPFAAHFWSPIIKDKGFRQVCNAMFLIYPLSLTFDFFKGHKKCFNPSVSKQCKCTSDSISVEFRSFTKFFLNVVSQNTFLIHSDFLLKFFHCSYSSSISLLLKFLTQIPCKLLFSDSTCCNWCSRSRAFWMRIR